MKFGPLIESNMRNIFLDKSHAKCDGETSPRPFSEKLPADHLLLLILSFYSPCLIFCTISEKKYFSCYIQLIDQV